MEVRGLQLPSKISCRFSEHVCCVLALGLLWICSPSSTIENLQRSLIIYFLCHLCVRVLSFDQVSYLKEDTSKSLILNFKVIDF